MTQLKMTGSPGHFVYDQELNLQSLVKDCTVISVIV